MRIFITGATGFIGQNLVKKLARENEVIALVRSIDKARVLPSNVKPIIGDISDLALLRRVTEGVDVVIHLAGLIHPVNVPDSLYYDVNVKGTENVVRASVENKVKHFIHCSSVTVYGVEDETKFIKEDQPCYGQNIYGKTKYEGEKVVKNLCTIPYTIIRPARVTGVGDSSLLIIYKLMKKRIFFNLGGGKSTMMPVFVGDVANAFKKAILNKKAFNKTYNVAGDEILTKKDFLKMIANLMGVKVWLIYLPVKPALFCARFMELFYKLVNKEPFISRKKLKFFLISRKYDTKVIKRDLDWKPMKNVKETMRELIEWYREL